MANSSSIPGSAGPVGPLPGSLASLVGTTLDGRFRIEEPIAHGAMGTVFLATQLSVSRKVAVKVLRDQLARTAVERFLREARAVASMTHPNVVQLVDFGETEHGLLYLVMEHVDGISLARLNRLGRLHPNLALEIATEICGGLAEAHSRGVVHRDLKPANVLVSRRADGQVQVKVVDFGVAHVFEDGADLTVSGALCGTPAYMAPEQALSKPVTELVDLYALGINLYEMLVGYRPFVGGGALQVAMKHVEGEAPTLRGFVERGVLPAPLVEVVEELLRKDAKERPQSAAALRQRLQAIRQQLGWSAVVLGGDADRMWTPWVLRRVAGFEGFTGEEETEDDFSAVVAPRDTESSDEESIVSRHGGGWDFFRAEKSQNDRGGGSVIDPNLRSTEFSATLDIVDADIEFESEPQLDAQPVAPVTAHSPPLPRSDASPRSADGMPRLADAAVLELADRPVRAARFAPKLADAESERVEPLRLLAVCVLSAAIVLGLGWGYLSLRTPTSAPKSTSTETPSADPPAVDATPAASDAPRKPPRKKKIEKEWREPIQLFEAPATEGERPRKIIIEEEK